MQTIRIFIFITFIHKNIHFDDYCPVRTELKPTASDIALAVEIVSAYLTDDTAAMLSAAYEQELGSGLGVPATADSTAGSQKRKADWELELEV